MHAEQEYFDVVAAAADVVVVVVAEMGCKRRRWKKRSGE